jgi:hypothetical protein
MGTRHKRPAAEKLDEWHTCIAQRRSRGPGPIKRAGSIMTTLCDFKDVVDHYNDFLKLALTEREKADLIEYLKSL